MFWQLFFGGGSFEEMTPYIVCFLLNVSVFGYIVFLEVFGSCGVFEVIKEKVMHLSKSNKLRQT